MSALLGILFHSIGGFASGSFYMPYNRVKGWSWEIFWLVGGLFSWLIMPLVLTAITVPNFTHFIATADGGMLRIVYLLGLLWGIGGLTYGLGVRYLGMSLGNSVTLGFCSAFGALVPPIYFDIYNVANRTTFTDMLHSNSGIVILVGVSISLLGIVILGKAGMMKEKSLSKEESQASVKEFNATKGLIVAIISGILSSFFNFGIEAGKPLANAAIDAGANPLFVNNLAFMVILWGGLTTNLIWTIGLIIKNKSFTQFKDISTPLKRNYLLCALAGSTWFLQFFFYGMGESQIGGGASSWILHMSTIILTANMWGIYNKEWKGVSKKIIIFFTLGIFTMLASVFLVGIGNAM